MNNKKKNILITGGSGFIGTHIVDRFLKDGNYNVTVLDLWESEEINNWKSKNKDLKFYKININNFEELENHMKNNSYFIHLAAILGTLETIINMMLKTLLKQTFQGLQKY